MARTISDKSLLKLLKQFVNNPNNGEIAFKIADLYLYGKGLAHNSKKALYYYTIAAENGHTYAMHMVGWSYVLGWHQKPNNKKAYYWFHKGAMLDDFVCTVDYGITLLQGLGCKKDVAKAAKYLAPCALKGDSSAQNGLAQCYLDKSFGVDYKKALYWFNESAKQNHFDALNQLGKMYENGTGVKKNLDTAYLYYLKASKAGSSDAKKRLKHWR